MIRIADNENVSHIYFLSIPLLPHPLYVFTGFVFHSLNAVSWYDTNSKSSP
jgi:hypothetical protein